MKDDNALALAVKTAPQSHSCCIAHLRSLLDGIRAEHRVGASASHPSGLLHEAFEESADSVSARDDYCSELEASMFAPDQLSLAFGEMEIRHDDPRELARARRVFAITLIIPMLLISSVLALFDSVLGGPMSSLLRSSLFALAIPLTGSAGAWLIRRLNPGKNNPLGVTHG